MKVPRPTLVSPRAFGALLLLVAAVAAVAAAYGPAGARLRAWHAERNERQAGERLLLGDTDGARAILRRALGRDPWRGESRRLLGQLELDHQHLEAAFLQFQTLAELHPESPAGWRGLARTWFAAGMPASAEGAATRAIDLGAAAAAPDRAPDYLLRARIRGALGRRYGAHLDLQRARALAPHDAEVAALDADFAAQPSLAAPSPPPPPERFWPGRLGNEVATALAALRAQDGAAAQERVVRAQRDFPGTMFGDWLAGVIAGAQGRYNDAERSLRSALAQAPRSSRVATQLAGVWAREAGPVEAGERLLALQAQDPGFLVPLDIAATAFLEARLPARADEALQRGIAGEAPSAAAFHQLAQHYAGLDRLAEALDANARGRERHPQDAELARQQAELQFLAGDRTAARATLEAELKIRPDALATRAALARVLAADAPRTDAARALARSLAEDSPSEPDALDALGWLLQRRGESDAALPWLAAAAQRAPDDPAIRYHHGAALKAAGRRAPARVELEAALATTAPFAERPEAQRLLNALR